MPEFSKKSFLKWQDEELVKLIRQGDRDAFNELGKRYIGLIYEITQKNIRDFNIAQMYFDDLIDIAQECLFVAVDNYITGQEKSFLNFWWSIVNLRQKSFYFDVVETKVLTLSPKLIESTFSEPTIGDGMDIEEYKRKAKEFIQKHKSVFTIDELTYLDYHLMFFEPLEVALVLSWSKPKIYRVRRSALAKLNRLKSN